MPALSEKDVKFGFERLIDFARLDLMPWKTIRAKEKLLANDCVLRENDCPFFISYTWTQEKLTVPFFHPVVYSHNIGGRVFCGACSSVLLGCVVSSLLILFGFHPVVLIR